MSPFGRLSFLALTVDGTDWPDVAGMLQLLPSRLDTLRIEIAYAWVAVDSDQLVKEDGERKAVRTNGLELLDPVLPRDNFKGLTLLAFELYEYRDTLPLYRESTLETIHQKLPTLQGRGGLDIQLYLSSGCHDWFPPPSPVVADSSESMHSVP